MMSNVVPLEVDQPAVAVEGATVADVSTTLVGGAMIAVDGEQGTPLAVVEPSQGGAAIEGAQLLDVTLVEDDPGMAVVGMPSGVMVAVNLTEGTADVTYARTVFTASTENLANLNTSNLEIDAYTSYSLSEVMLSHPSRIRIYTDSTSRANDASRSIGTDPNPGSGLVAEVVSIVPDYRQIVTPFVVGGNLDNPPSGIIYMSVTNQSGSTQPITVSLTLLQLEK
jgi:hypothetical protein